MPVDRPTFSESWYRVAELCPRLRATVQAHRQHFRGQMWHVLQDPSSNQFFRLNNAAYRFVALLDGRRTVADAWRVCNEQLGDHAPTQGEAIQLLGQLYTSNLLQAELPPDTEGLFERYHKRVRREVQGYLMNLLFIRIPLLDPDRFLDATIKTIGWIFSWVGMLVWSVLVAAGLYFVIGHWGELSAGAQDVLKEDNLILLYISFALIKVIHEFGHAYACKKFGRQTGTGGEVHVMGIMFLIFTPIPYVDASSSWAFRSKWHRIVVGAGGMLVELAVASIAAVVWANTSQGVINSIAYNVMFVASVSTLLFNANPLLRYDGYYIFSDLLEIPNLYQRSKQYLYYLVKKYVWKVRQTQNPASTRGEKGWMVSYAIASTIYRVVICVGILLFVADKLFMVGAVLAVAAVVAWVCVPLVKFVHYLASNGELYRVRSRAIATTVATVVLILVAIGLIPRPDRTRIDGVVEPVRLAIVHAEEDGFVRQFRPSGQQVQPGDWLIRAENPSLDAHLKQLLAERDVVAAKEKTSRSSGVLSEAQALEVRRAKLDEEIATTRRQLDSLEVKASVAGLWISPKVEEFTNAYMKRGDRLGVVASLDDLLIRATAGQDVAGLLMGLHREGRRVPLEIKVRGRPDKQLGGEITKVIEAGQDRLPSAALGYMVGGSMATDTQDQQGMKAAEEFFEIHVRPETGPDHPLLPGQRVVVRLDMPSRPMIQQWERSLRQLILRRFHGS